MDPNGGNNPSAPKLDNTQPQQPAGAQLSSDPNQTQPTDIYEQPQSFDGMMGGGASIPPEMPASGPDTGQTPDLQQTMPPAPEPPQFQDPYAQQPQDPQAGMQPMGSDPMMGQPMMDSPAPVQGGGKNKVVMIAGGAVLALILLGGSAYAGYTMGKSAGRQEAAAEFQAQQAALQEEQTTDTVEDVLLEGLDQLEPLSPKEEDLTGVIGEQINASDGFILYVTNIERNFQVDDPSYELDEGKELVKVNFVLGNVTEDRPKDIQSASLYLLEGENATKIIPESRLSDYEGNFDTLKIEPGSQATGSIVFAVSKNAEPLVFVREQEYRITNQNKELTTKISIALSE